MDNFLTTLFVVLIAMLYMIIGFAVKKFKLAKTEHLKTLSGILIYVLGPCMTINAILSVDYSLDNLAKMGIFFLVSLLLQVLFAIFMWLIIRKKMAISEYRVTLIASIFGNVGFFGLPLIQSLFPDSPIVLAYSSIFVLTMNILAFTLGSYAITGDKKYMSIKKAFLNPTTIAILIALPLYLCKVNINDLDVFGDAIGLLGKMTTPVCMIILGIRLASVSLKKLVSRPFVYVACGLKLIVFPLFCLLLVYFLPFLDKELKLSIFVLAATPSAAVIQSLSEMYGVCEEDTANIVLFATVLCVITIPILMLIL